MDYRKGVKQQQHDNRPTTAANTGSHQHHPSASSTTDSNAAAPHPTAAAAAASGAAATATPAPSAPGPGQEATAATSSTVAATTPTQNALVTGVGGVSSQPVAASQQHQQQPNVTAVPSGGGSGGGKSQQQPVTSSQAASTGGGHASLICLEEPPAASSSTALVVATSADPAGGGLTGVIAAAAATAAPAASTAAAAAAAAASSASSAGTGPTAATASWHLPKSDQKPVMRPAVFDKLEQLVRDMQDDEHGVPVRSQKLFLTSIPAAFMGYDLIEWLMDRLNIEDSLEAVHLANLLCQFGYYFPVNELKNLMVKDDSSLYRFQAAYYWPSQNHTPDNLEYAVYLAKRSQRNRQKHGLEDYEGEAYNNLRKILANRWDLVVMQAEEQIKVGKDRKKLDKIITDSQEKAYWRVYRPPPGYTTVVESSPVPSREQRVKARNRTKVHLSEEVNFLRNYGATARVKVSLAAEGLIEYCEKFFEYDPVVSVIEPSNPWMSNDETYWHQNLPIVDQPTEKRVRRWAISLEDLVDDPQGLQEFLGYLKKEYSHENLRFWISVQELRYGPGTEAKIKKKVKEIWDEFLSPGAKAEINIDAMTMEATKSAIKTPSRYTYEKAADHVFLLLLKKDCYPRFVRSQYYKTLLSNAVNPSNQKKRFILFGDRTKKKPATQPGAAGASCGNQASTAVPPHQNEKMPWEEFNIHGADGGDCSDSPEEGTRKICTTYSSKDADDNVCPWEEEGATLPTRHHSKENPANAGAKGSEGSSLVRRGSDPTLLTSSKVGSPSKSTTAGATRKTPTASIATTTLMQAVKDLPGTTAGIMSPRSSLSAYPEAAAAAAAVAGAVKKVATAASPQLESQRIGRASSTEGTLSSEQTQHHHYRGAGCSSHHHHHKTGLHPGTSSRRTKNRSRRRKGESSTATAAAAAAAAAASSTAATDPAAAVAALPAGQGPPVAGGDVADTAEEKKVGACSGGAATVVASASVKSHHKPHHQLSTSSLLTSVAAATVAPASVLAAAPFDQSAAAVVKTSEAVKHHPTAESSEEVQLSTAGNNKQGTSSKCTQTRMAACEEETIPTSPTLARQSPMIGQSSSSTRRGGGGGCSPVNDTTTDSCKLRQANVPVMSAGTTLQTGRNSKGATLKASGSSDRGSDSEQYRSSSDKEVEPPKAKFEHCSKHCVKVGGEHQHRHHTHKCHHSHQDCHREKKSVTSSRPSDSVPVTSSEPVEGPGPPPAMEGGGSGGGATRAAAAAAEVGVGGDEQHEHQALPSATSTSEGGGGCGAEESAASTCEKKGETGKWATEVCPWEDEKNKKDSHAPFVKTYATLGYL